MSTYKVIQDVEAEDKLVGPLSLRQFIYACISAFCIWLGFMAYAKGAGFIIFLLAPIALFSGFLAAPWGGDQPTELWAIAKLRFYLKPRRRIWDQSGAKELVTVTVPKQVMRNLTDGLSQQEVRSRLNALAKTIDSRGWAVKNANINMATLPAVVAAPSDRLVSPLEGPQEVSTIDVRAEDDIMDERANPIARQFDTMINQAAAEHRQQLVQQLSQPSSSAPPLTQTAATSSAANDQANPDYWFMHQPQTVPGQAAFVDAAVVRPGVPDQQAAILPQAATPTEEEKALVEKFKSANDSQAVAYSHMKTLKTPAQLAEEQRIIQAEAARKAAEEAARKAAEAEKARVTSERQADIINLSNNDDLDIATLSRQAKKSAVQSDDGEVVISLR